MEQEQGFKQAMHNMHHTVLGSTVGAYLHGSSEALVLIHELPFELVPTVNILPAYLKNIEVNNHGDLDVPMFLGLSNMCYCSDSQGPRQL